MIDIEHAKLRMGGCDEAVLAEISEILRKEIPLRLSEIDKALAEQDSVGVTRAAHTLKGAAGMFKATCFVTVAEQIEGLGREQKLDQVPSALDQLKKHASTLEHELGIFLASVEQV